jgi:hypothetical protein
VSGGGPREGGYALPGNLSLVFLVLSELPDLSPNEVLGVLLTVLGLPIVASQLTFDDDLLTLLGELREVLGWFSPYCHVYESSDLLALSFAIVVELIVSDGGRSHWSTGLSVSQSWVSNQVTGDDDAIDVHSNMRLIVSYCWLTGRRRFGSRQAVLSFCSPGIDRFPGWREKLVCIAIFLSKPGTAVLRLTRRKETPVQEPRGMPETG